jgi:O-methyltransferase
MEVPGLGLVKGEWDLRDIVDQYLGKPALAAKRVLEIGPASGFLTAEMEKRGADVVAVEVPDDPGWDFVPYPAALLAPLEWPRRQGMRALKNSWWYVHTAYQLKARLIYGNVYELPDVIGTFDIAVMAAVLLHCHSPLQVIDQCAKRADTLIITDRFFPELSGSPVCRLEPTADNKTWDTWWAFSTDAISNFLGVLGFTIDSLYTYTDNRMRPLFTITATRR